jgi:hypothetical protein
LKSIHEQGDATVRAERAWLIIRPDAFVLEPGNRLDWIILNSGRTTATISKAQVRCKKYAGMSTLLTAPPDRENPSTFSMFQSRPIFL